MNLKKGSKFALILLAGLALAGCSNNQNSKTVTHKASKISAGLVEHKNKPTKLGHLKANDLSPQKTVAVITAYAGKKYSDDWGTSLKKAQTNGLRVNLENQSDFSYMKNGSGVAYLVSDGNGYTLKQVNGENIYYLYDKEEELTSVTMGQMINYLNKSDSDELVNDLAKNAKIVNQRTESSDSTNDKTSHKTNIPADGGLFNIPAQYQGTWHTYPADDNKLDVTKITQHQIMDGNDVKELHKINDNTDDDYIEKYAKSKSYLKATKNWGRVSFWNRRGIKYMNVMGWMQGAGDGVFYGIHTENEQPVLVVAYGAGLWTNCVAWKTPQLAQQYKHKKFKDLVYQDDE
ncbi:hypothetical protein OQI87_05525 [Lactobacillus kefiranofaciens]|uniref:hypothetical protein n=1 Tax=Lactobacillus kefiranofaciens TaxID=267818 RepID=UPI0024684C62|nr:hypothetical protein [Lactobacillus kefiranofaciens]MDH5100594.1 hypothetical protein [Lactobacillus kefiranofaciens]